MSMHKHNKNKQYELKTPTGWIKLCTECRPRIVGYWFDIKK